jgi:hypothetical protein
MFTSSCVLLSLPSSQADSAPIVSSAPRVRILMTSREPMPLLEAHSDVIKVSKVVVKGSNCVAR